MKDNRPDVSRDFYNKKIKKEIPVGKRCYVPKKGYGLNPMLNYPRNYPCFCGSNTKFKKCCLNKLARYIPKKEILYYNNKLKGFLVKVKEYEKKVKPKNRRLKEDFGSRTNIPLERG